MAKTLTDVREISKLAYGFMASRALFAALELRLFGHIAVGGAGDLTEWSLCDRQAVTGALRSKLQPCNRLCFFVA